MKLGFLSSILDGWSYEEVIDIAYEMGFKCVEVACWPKGKAERRYAGVSHIDAERVLKDDEYASHILSYASSRSIELSSLGYYPNALCSDEAKREETINHLSTLIKASSKLGINMVTTFIGRDQYLTDEENFKLVEKIWPPIIKEAEEYGVRIAIENCPMLFGPDQWPGGQNIFTSPSNWERVFSILNSENLGINFDPSHFVWQMLDYNKAVYDYSDKIFHVHFKDIKLYWDKLGKVGTTAYPLSYMSPKLPSYGDVKWNEFCAALTDIRYEGYAVIEIEDKAFEGSRERILDSLRISKRYMENFVI